jgi:hypothetical protein
VRERGPSLRGTLGSCDFPGGVSHQAADQPLAPRPQLPLNRTREVPAEQFDLGPSLLWFGPRCDAHGAAATPTIGSDSGLDWPIYAALLSSHVIETLIPEGTCGHQLTLVTRCAGVHLRAAHVLIREGEAAQSTWPAPSTRRPGNDHAGAGMSAVARPHPGRLRAGASRLHPASPVRGASGGVSKSGLRP